jgi:predicted transcriptional regulator/transcriptional regulator with XRE-family HTH domain
MAERKIFAGARLKRLRLRLGVSQSQMAAELGLSPSYLNLIERDQRPLTVQVLLKLSGAYGIEATALSGGEGGVLLDTLKEIFADPLLAGEVASPAELADMAEAAPNAARGLARLHEAWREALERLSNLSQAMAGQARSALTGADAPALPTNRADAYFEAVSPWFPAIEAAAEAVAASLSPRDDPAQALKAHLRTAHGVETRVLPAQIMPVEQARYDRHSGRLFVSERVPLLERPFLLARQIALLGHRELLDGLTAEAGLAEPEAARLCRLGYARRLAEAMLAPAERLAEALRETGPDPLRLSERFVLRPWRVMARLAALGASGRAEATAAFTLLLDGSGGVVARQPGAGFPFPRFGPFCARLPLFDGLRPGQPVHAELEFTEGSRFLVTAIAEDGIRSAGLPAPRRLALIGWRSGETGQPPRWPAPASRRPVGVTCRLCERPDCAHRLHPPMTRPVAFHEHVVGPSDAELAG